MAHASYVGGRRFDLIFLHLGAEAFDLGAEVFDLPAHAQHLLASWGGVCVMRSDLMCFLLWVGGWCRSRIIPYIYVGVKVLIYL